MTDTSPILYIMFVAIIIAAAVWWKQGLMPWWFASLVPFTTLVGLLQHRPERMMAGAIVMAGIGNLCWPYRGIRYMERNQGRRGNAVFARFFASPIGTIVYRLTGLAAIGIGIGMWSAPPRSFEASAEATQPSYPSTYRHLMENLNDRVGRVDDRQSDKSLKFTIKDNVKDCEDWAKIFKDIARQLRLLTVPLDSQDIHSKTLSYLDANARNYQKWSIAIASPNKDVRRKMLVEMGAPDPYEAELRLALKRAGEKSDEFALVLKELFPPKAKK